MPIRSLPPQKQRVLLSPPKPTLPVGRSLLVLSPMLALGAMLLVFAYMISETRTVAERQQTHVATLRGEKTDTLVPFPVGVRQRNEEIVELPEADQYLANHAYEATLAQKKHTGVVANVFTALTRSLWFQSLASPTARIIILESGERKEEVMSNLSRLLNWNSEEQKRFLELMTDEQLADGTWYPGTYVTARNATPEEMAPLIIDRFTSEVRARYTEDVEREVPLRDAIIIASLLEREARDFTDMRLISGVIWNRLFDGMKLQLDATLQYAKAGTNGTPWWGIPTPADKNITSTYNTYKHNGLPPGPIANPSLEAIVAALNPKKTECLFYFHTRNGDFVCSPTYEGHVALLKQHYGQGK
jgi:cell division protein YceG involved in septum cleavage